MSSGLAPRAFSEREPDTERAVGGFRDAISNEVGPALLIGKTTVETPSAYLDDKSKLTDVMHALRPEADLDVTDLRWSGPRLLGTVDGFGNNGRQETREPSKLAIRNARVVRHIDEWHSTHSAAPSSRPDLPIGMLTTRAMEPLKGSWGPTW